MQHTSKMVLVPENVYKQMVPPNVTNMANLDQQMDNVLSDSSIPPDVKAAQHNQLARRYRFLQDQMFQEKPKKEENFQVHNDSIIESLPRNLRNKGKLLINHMKNNPDQFRFTVKGELLNDEGNIIEGSNITDLVHESVRNRKSGNVSGREEFMSMLSETNVPKEALGKPLFNSTPKPSTFHGHFPLSKYGRPQKPRLNWAPLEKTKKRKTSG